MLHSVAAVLSRWLSNSLSNASLCAIAGHHRCLEWWNGIDLRSVVVLMCPAAKLVLVR